MWRRREARCGGENRGTAEGTVFRPREPRYGGGNRGVLTHILCSRIEYKEDGEAEIKPIQTKLEA